MMLRRIAMNAVETGSAGVSAGNPNPGNSAPPAANPTPAADWTSGLNEGLRGYVQTKNFKDPGQVVDAYQNLEKLMGVPKERLLKLPEKPDDPAWSDVYGRLGRPEKPEGYGLEVPEGGNKEFADWASKNFHELGLTRKQGEALVTKWNELQKTTSEGAQQTKAQEAQTQRDAIKKEWGAAYPKNVEMMEQAAEKFGLTKDMVAKLGDSLGIDKTAKFLLKIGSQLGEDSFVTGTGGSKNFGPLSPQQARDRLAYLKSDKEFTQRYLNRDFAAVDEMDKLFQWANPDES